MAANWLWIAMSVGLVGAIVAIGIWWKALRDSLEKAPKLGPIATIPATLPSLTVIIPAYNEALNIQDCIRAVLQNELPPNVQLQVIIADDESTDDTAALAQTIAATDPRVQVFTVPPRPTTAIWRGKNWACAQAVQQATGEYWLFIDADVRLEPRAIATTLTEAQQQQIDLLSLGPEIICGCLSEWLVQPLMLSVIVIGFKFDGVNDPKDKDTAFAAGMFMLFKASTYSAIGGHAAIAADPVEDVGLAKRIKATGYKLGYSLAEGIIKVRMYQNLAGLWEGWTKNFYLGANRNVGTVFFAALALFLVFVMPWLGLLTVVVGRLNGVAAASWSQGSGGLWAVTLLSLIALVWQYQMRASTAQLLKQPLRYWALSWVGGLILMAIAIVSMIKTETGWGWTWRGRSLAPQAAAK
jgi:cellulose synthase/poly-beta-1,6-N-acetylglucosamine synthase-like glycosyltransferase